MQPSLLRIVISEGEMMTEWVKVCRKSELPDDSGVGALVHGHQIALFYQAELDRVFAIDNHDPVMDANVICHGIIGDLKGQWVVASPLLKQHYNLETGQCLEKSELRLRVWPVRVCQDQIEVQWAGA
ncbi:nitrite reductase small subunit NirD [Pokkaliibacter plantistimulans]|nr:nitrite reductase small subunit NirD [Pokkaliibacter plantistimulans]